MGAGSKKSSPKSWRQPRCRVDQLLPLTAGGVCGGPWHTALCAVGAGGTVFGGDGTSLVAADNPAAGGGYGVGGASTRDRAATSVPMRRGPKYRFWFCA